MNNANGGLFKKEYDMEIKRMDGNQFELNRHQQLAAAP